MAQTRCPSSFPSALVLFGLGMVALAGLLIVDRKGRRRGAQAEKVAGSAMGAEIQVVGSSIATDMFTPKNGSSPDEIIGDSGSGKHGAGLATPALGKATP